MIKHISKRKRYTTVCCSWCGDKTTNNATYECDRCWELRNRIESNVELTKRMLQQLEK